MMMETSRCTGRGLAVAVAAFSAGAPRPTLTKGSGIWNDHQPVSRDQHSRHLAMSSFAIVASKFVLVPCTVLGNIAAVRIKTQVKEPSRSEPTNPRGGLLVRVACDSNIRRNFIRLRDSMWVARLALLFLPAGAWIMHVPAQADSEAASSMHNS